MEIFESSFDYIDTDNIRLIRNRGNHNNTYFTDGRHTYHFSKSKNTLYMIFDDMELLDTVAVEILEDPFAFLEQIFQDNHEGAAEAAQTIEANGGDMLEDNQLCLRLYTESRARGKYVAEKSGLNQWNAGGRARHPDEVYIPYQAVDRERKPGFFPPRYVPFEIILPDGQRMSAAVCQSDGKAIMSNPNKDLGHWLLRDVLEVPEGTLITYDMLELFGIDSVIFTKLEEGRYSVDFCQLGTYDRVYNTNDEDDDL